MMCGAELHLPSRPAPPLFNPGHGGRQSQADRIQHGTVHVCVHVCIVCVGVSVSGTHALYGNVLQ